MTKNSDPYKPTNQPNTESLNVAQLLGEGEAMFIEHNLYFGHGTDSAWDEAVSIYLMSSRSRLMLTAHFSPMYLRRSNSNRLGHCFDGEWTNGYLLLT